MQNQELKDRRVPVMLSTTELKALDEWRRRQPEIPSRGEAVRQAVRQFIRPALEAKPQKKTK